MENMIEIKEISSDLVPKKLLIEADPSIERVNQYLKDSLCYVALIQKEIVGVCILKPIDKFKIELFNIAVLPETRNQVSDHNYSNLFWIVSKKEI